MFIETQTGNLLNVNAIRIVNKPNIPQIGVSGLNDYHQEVRGASKTRLLANDKITLYKSVSIFEVQVAYEIVREFLKSGKTPHYQDQSNMLNLSTIDFCIDCLHESLEELLIQDEYIGKTIQWGIPSNSLFNKIDFNRYKEYENDISWELAALESLVMNKEHNKFIFTTKGITIPKDE